MIRWICKDGCRKVRGIPSALAESAAYPRHLGQRIYARHTGQYSASAIKPAAQPRQRQQKITNKGHQQLTTSSPARRSAKMWLQPHASIDLFRPASSIPWWPVGVAAAVPKSKTGCTAVPMHLLLRQRHRGAPGACGHNPVPQEDGEDRIPQHAAFSVRDCICFVGSSFTCVQMHLEVKRCTNHACVTIMVQRYASTQSVIMISENASVRSKILDEFGPLFQVRSPEE